MTVYIYSDIVKLFFILLFRCSVMSELCDPMDCSTTGFPVLHQLLELAQTHVHWVGDAIQPSCPLLSPSPHAFSLFQHQDLYQWVSSLHQFRSVQSFSVQLLHPYMTTGKTIALPIQTFVGKVMSLVFNTLSRFVIAFLPRNKHLLTSGCSHHLQWIWSPRK